MSKEEKVYSPERIQENLTIISNSRVFSSLIFGIVTGTFGITGYIGFLIYILVSLFTSSFLYLSLQGNMEKYIKTPSELWTHGMVQGGLTFILFWT